MEISNILANKSPWFLTGVLMPNVTSSRGAGGEEKAGPLRLIPKCTENSSRGESHGFPGHHSTRAPCSPPHRQRGPPSPDCTVSVAPRPGRTPPLGASKACTQVLSPQDLSHHIPHARPAHGAYEDSGVTSAASQGSEAGCLSIRSRLVWGIWNTGAAGGGQPGQAVRTLPSTHLERQTPCLSRSRESWGSRCSQS